MGADRMITECKTKQNMEHIFRSPSGERKRSRAKRIELNERAVAVYDTPEIRYIQTPPY